MIVNSDQPFQIVYAIFSHEFLGLLLESYVVQVDEQGRLSYAYQNISSANAKEFDSGLDKNDYELIKLMDSMRPLVVAKNAGSSVCGCSCTKPSTPLTHHRATTKMPRPALVVQLNNV